MKSEVFNKSVQNQPNWKSTSIDDKELLKKNNGAIVFSQTTENETIGGLVQNIDGNYCLFPVPDPTLVYFHNAQMNLIQYKKVRKELLKNLNSEAIKENIPIHELYNFYGYATSVVINLFTALESFLNQQIPTSYSFEKKAGKCTEVYSYNQIMENIDFKTKITKVIPVIKNKDFMSKSSSIAQYIWNLKSFRDDIIHTKPQLDNPLYRDLMKKTVNFKYDKVIDAIVKFMNFYQEDYIKECDCDKEY